MKYIAIQNLESPISIEDYINSDQFRTDLQSEKLEISDNFGELSEIIESRQHLFNVEISDVMEIPEDLTIEQVYCSWVGEFFAIVSIKD